MTAYRVFASNDPGTAEYFTTPEAANARRDEYVHEYGDRGFGITQSGDGIRCYKGAAQVILFVQEIEINE